MQPNSTPEWNDPPDVTTRIPRSRRAYHSISSAKQTSRLPNLPQPYNQHEPSVVNQPQTKASNQSLIHEQVSSENEVVTLSIPSDPVAFYIPPALPLQPELISKHYRPTMTVAPNSQNLLNKTKLPFGLIITPYPHPEITIPTVHGPIVRCRKCRSYINPFSEWVHHGNKYKCNICFLVNEIPPDYNYDVVKQQPIDRDAHSELLHSIVEFVAPAEYMVRPPQANAYLFVIDVSYLAIRSGMVATAARIISDALDSIPNRDGRTKIGFILFDKVLYFVNLNNMLEDPQLLISGELEDIYLPRPDDLLVNLNETKTLVENFLAKLPGLFQSTQVSSNVLGSALKAAHQLLSPLGGKTVVLLGSLPNVGDGMLKSREDPNVLGTSKESTLLSPDTSFYRKLAVECSRDQICVDIFVLTSQYSDLVSLYPISKFTGGHMFHYPGFSSNIGEDAMKFANEFSHFLSRKVGLEAVLRIRASKGIVINSYHGNFFTRQTDLLALANVNPDHSYGVDFGIEGTIGYPVVSVQTALLYTSSNGERRIRVMTLALPVVESAVELYVRSDSEAIVNLYSKMVADMVGTCPLDNMRDFVFSKCVDIFASARKVLGTTSPHLICTPTLKNLPSLMLGLVKTLGLRRGRMPSDLRCLFLNLLSVASVETSTILFYPNFYSLHDLSDCCGVAGEDGLESVLLPRPMNPSSERMQRGGLYLVDNGLDLYMWVSSSLPQSITQDIFGAESSASIPGGKYTLSHLETDWSARIRNIVAKIQWMHNSYPCLYIVKEDGDPGLKTYFLSLLIEDQSDNNPSYFQWLSLIREKIFKDSNT